eukprot:TRINITY_DN7429_c0_g1_i1.p2 TRINITY_DN7429_c0_g1~~TRINITY_DN7429_c0_g1_i1.p2  ORF type:complete len:208 (-),score=26.42 TRINITY_DN7429_c0_g1_i1:58-681(-)
MADHDDPGHGKAGHKCSNDCNAVEFSLYNHINNLQVRCLNEAEVGSAKKIFKSYAQKLDKTISVRSLADEELIIFIPFTGVVKLKNICIIGGPEGTSPNKVKIFTNREDIDFDNVRDVKAAGEFDLAENFDGKLEYPTKGPKYSNLSNITLYIPSNHGADETVIYYIGLKGEYTPVNRDIVITNYELRPNPAKNAPLGEEATGRRLL